MTSYQVGKCKPPKINQFKKGQSGNPEGARKHDPLKKMINQMTSEELKRVICDTVLSTEKELKKKIASPDISLCEIIVGRAILKAITKSDYTLFNKIIERVIGKVK